MITGPVGTPPAVSPKICIVGKVYDEWGTPIQIRDYLGKLLRITGTDRDDIDLEIVPDMPPTVGGHEV